MAMSDRLELQTLELDVRDAGGNLLGRLLVEGDKIGWKGRNWKPQFGFRMVALTDFAAFAEEKGSKKE